MELIPMLIQITPQQRLHLRSQIYREIFLFIIKCISIRKVIMNLIVKSFDLITV